MNLPTPLIEELRDTLTLILAGGKGQRLKPLTSGRAKPAVPFGGAYRIIDFTLSNCIHSGLRQIFVLTQYLQFALGYTPLEAAVRTLPFAVAMIVVAPRGPALGRGAYGRPRGSER